MRIKKVDGVQIHAVSGQYKAERDRATAHKGEGLTEHKKEDHHRHLEDAIGEVRCTPSLSLSRSSRSASGPKLTPRPLLQYDVFSKAVLDKMLELAKTHSDEMCVPLAPRLVSLGR